MDSSQSPPPPQPPIKPQPPQPPPYTPQMPTESRVKSFKLIWRIFMIANLGLGAYMFAKAKMQEASLKKEKEKPHVKDPPVEEPPPPAEDPPSKIPPGMDYFEETDNFPPTPIADLVKVHEPIPEDQQRELFEWVLDEKRKVTPRDKKEKKQIDAEKAILKRFIRSESIPPL